MGKWTDAAEAKKLNDDEVAFKMYDTMNSGQRKKFWADTQIAAWLEEHGIERPDNVS